MNKWFWVWVLAAALSLWNIAGCDKPKGIKESAYVTDITTALIVRINDVLELPENAAIKEVLKKMTIPAVCTIMTQTDSQGMSDSKIVCQTPPMPDHPKGLLAIVWPVSFPTTLWANNHLSTGGVTLENGVFNPNSGCGIYELDASREVIGSNHPVCKEVNQGAAELVERYERMIDEWLSQGDKV